MICSYYYHITFSEDVVSGLTPKVDLCQMQTPLMSVRLLKSYKYPSIPSRFIPISLSDIALTQWSRPPCILPKYRSGSI